MSPSIFSTDRCGSEMSLTDVTPVQELISTQAIGPASRFRESLRRDEVHAETDLSTQPAGRITDRAGGSVVFCEIFEIITNEGKIFSMTNLTKKNQKNKKPNSF